MHANEPEMAKKWEKEDESVNEANASVIRKKLLKKFGEDPLYREFILAKTPKEQKKALKTLKSIRGGNAVRLMQKYVKKLQGESIKEKLRKVIRQEIKSINEAQFFRAKQMVLLPDKKMYFDPMNDNLWLMGPYGGPDLDDDPIEPGDRDYKKIIRKLSSKDKSVLKKAMRTRKRRKEATTSVSVPGYLSPQAFSKSTQNAIDVDDEDDNKNESVNEGFWATPAAFSSQEAKLHLDMDIKKMSKHLGKASQKVIKIMMDGVKGNRYDALDIQRGLQHGPATRTHHGEAEFIQMLWRKVRDGFRRYSKDRKLRK
jgi:hypothetical protein